MIGPGNIRYINDTEGWSVFIFEYHDVTSVQMVKDLSITAFAQIISWTESLVMRFTFSFEGNSLSIFSPKYSFNHNYLINNCLFLAPKTSTYLKTYQSRSSWLDRALVLPPSVVSGIIVEPN